MDTNVIILGSKKISRKFNSSILTFTLRMYPINTLLPLLKLDYEISLVFKEKFHSRPVKRSRKFQYCFDTLQWI
jgi:hypothetical protein